MRVDQDGLYREFCCTMFEIYSKHPLKAIRIDPEWKEFDNSAPVQRACIFTFDTSGLAAKSGKTEKAGRTEIGISFCPWCSKEITFE